MAGTRPLLALLLVVVACGSTDAAPPPDAASQVASDSQPDVATADSGSEVQAEVDGVADASAPSPASLLHGTWQAPTQQQYGATIAYTWTFGPGDQVSFQTVTTQPSDEPNFPSCKTTSIMTGTYSVAGQLVSLHYAATTAWMDDCKDPTLNKAKTTTADLTTFNTTLTFAGPDAFVVGATYAKTEGPSDSLLGTWSMTIANSTYTAQEQYSFADTEWQGLSVGAYVDDGGWLAGCTAKWLYGPGSYQVTWLPGGLGILELTTSKAVYIVQGCSNPASDKIVLEKELRVKPLGFLPTGAKQAFLGYPYVRQK